MQSKLQPPCSAIVPTMTSLTSASVMPGRIMAQAFSKALSATLAERRMFSSSSWVLIMRTSSRSGLPFTKVMPQFLPISSTLKAWAVEFTPMVFPSRPSFFSIS